MATIEELLAIINDNPKALADMSDEELLKALGPCLLLEPKPLNKPAVEINSEEEQEEDDPNPIKIAKKKTKKERLKNVLNEADKLFEELGEE